LSFGQTCQNLRFCPAVQGPQMDATVRISHSLWGTRTSFSFHSIKNNQMKSLALPGVLPTPPSGGVLGKPFGRETPSVCVIRSAGSRQATPQSSMGVRENEAPANQKLELLTHSQASFLHKQGVCRMICAGTILETRNMRMINYLRTTARNYWQSGARCTVADPYNHRTRCLLFLHPRDGAAATPQCRGPGARKPICRRVSENLGNRCSHGGIALTHASSSRVSNGLDSSDAGRREEERRADEWRDVAWKDI
jgi:hypothetical protein